ncbi:hypothetical protein V6U89_10310 [Micromonospora sp. CPCC 206171]|uniref:hypothetical protein n=1 Tax=Micromonospora sp. CPCC 206171 TaxID=3122405 RepID=UPI002FF24F8C
MGAIDILKGWSDPISAAVAGQVGDGIRPGWTEILFVPPGEVFDGRPDTPGIVAVLTRFSASPEHAGLAAAGH